MVKKTSPALQSKLSAWLWRAPAKFAMAAVFMPMILAGLYAIIASAFTAPENQPIATWPMMTLMFAGLAWAIWKLIKWLPRGAMDQRSFAGVYTASFFISRLSGLLGMMFVGFMYFPMLVALSNPMHSPGTTLWVLVALTILALFAAYVGGLQITDLYVTYRRAITMGVPRWKTILSMPFSMLWMPAYMLGDEKSRREPAVNVRPTWFSNMVNWIIATPVNTWTMFVVTIIVSGLLYGFGWMIFPTFAAPVIIFGLWQLIAGTSHMRKNIGGAFATVAIIVNILTIAAVITINVMTYRIMDQATPLAAPDAQIEIVDTELVIPDAQ
ncbi:MAG: hypothetical protein K2L94_03665 [Alphaproteobacteria bacterium]|nr:hypothetical protein [Alphaproteobacteria bacterium]